MIFWIICTFIYSNSNNHLFNIEFLYFVAFSKRVFECLYCHLPYLTIAKVKRKLNNLELISSFTVWIFVETVIQSLHIRKSMQKQKGCIQYFVNSHKSFPKNQANTNVNYNSFRDFKIIKINHCVYELTMNDFLYTINVLNTKNLSKATKTPYFS